MVRHRLRLGPDPIPEKPGVVVYGQECAGGLRSGERFSQCDPEEGRRPPGYQAEIKRGQWTDGRLADQRDGSAASLVQFLARQSLPVMSPR
jgi:hypothetical protein